MTRIPSSSTAPDMSGADAPGSEESIEDTEQLEDETGLDLNTDSSSEESDPLHGDEDSARVVQAPD